MKNEYSLKCELCESYNIKEGFIIDGLVYCWNCIKNPDIKIILKRTRQMKK